MLLAMNESMDVGGVTQIVKCWYGTQHEVEPVLPESFALCTQRQIWQDAHLCIPTVG